jgi:hypothetical protein
MTNEQEIIAKALEIAISLTGAKYTWLRTDEYNNLLIDDPLYITMKNVIQIMNDKKLLDFDYRCKVSRGTFNKDLS